jgi:hypothetical protein
MGSKNKCKGVKRDGTPCMLNVAPGDSCCRYHKDQPACKQPSARGKKKAAAAAAAGAGAGAAKARSTPRVVEVDETAPCTLDDEEVTAVLRFLRRFPIAKYRRQASTDNVLEEFASELVVRVLNKIPRVEPGKPPVVGRDMGRWTCIIAEDGHFGVVSDFNKCYDTHACTVDVLFDDTAFKVYMFD